MVCSSAKSNKTGDESKDGRERASEEDDVEKGGKEGRVGWLYAG